MKKIYMFLLVAFLAVNASAQVDVTFQVDLTDYLKVAGNKVSKVRVAGNFAAQVAKAGGVVMNDWDPPMSPAFTALANNVYSVKVTFPNAAKGADLLFKFLNTATTWGACGIDQECMPITAGTCMDASNADGNRKLKIPTVATTICFKWDACTACGSKVGVNDSLLENDVTITPNPTSLNALVSIEGNDVYTINVTNAVGQVVRTIQNVSGQAIIEREGLSSGLHFVNIRNSEGKFQTKKLIIE
jgi:hypothetical protein